jgi:peptidyl-tRNA hydrolase
LAIAAVDRDDRCVMLTGAAARGHARREGHNVLEPARRRTSVAASIVVARRTSPIWPFAVPVAWPPMGQDDDPYRMYLVVRRGAFDDLETGGVLAGAAAVACLRRFADDPDHAEAIAAWRERPGKVTLRARGGQWDQVLQHESFTYAGDLDGAAVLALAPQRRSERSETLTKLQAMASALAPPPTADVAPAADAAGRMTYIINPSLAMSTGKTMAQVAHAATMSVATGRVEPWVRAGCPGRVVVPAKQALFDALCTTDAPTLSAKVEDAGLTEVAPGTITVLAIPPAPA